MRLDVLLVCVGLTVAPAACGDEPKDRSAIEDDVRAWALDRQGVVDAVSCAPTDDERVFRCEATSAGVTTLVEATSSRDGERVQILER